VSFSPSLFLPSFLLVIIILGGKGRHGGALLPFFSLLQRARLTVMFEQFLERPGARDGGGVFADGWCVLCLDCFL
jgi:hypothetical protein